MNRISIQCCHSPASSTRTAMVPASPSLSWARAMQVSPSAPSNGRLYALRPEGLADAAGLIERMWSAQLQRLKDAVESERDH